MIEWLIGFLAAGFIEFFMISSGKFKVQVNTNG
jgi:hypothetical protein